MKQSGMLYIVLLFSGFGIGIWLQSIHTTRASLKPAANETEPAAILSQAPTPALTATPTPTGIVLPPIIFGERVMKVPILLYHYISVSPYKDDKTRNGLSTPPEILDQQLKLISDNGFTTITFDELARSPNVVFSAHSVHHYALSKVSQQALEQEVVESKQTLERHIGYTVNWMAYPYGSFNEKVVWAVKKAGYIGAITTLPGVWQYKSRFYHIPRYRVGTRVGNELLKIID